MGKVCLGDRVRDPLTGYEGIAVVRSDWLWGCARIGVQANAIKDEKPVEEAWFDEDRLEVIEMRAYRPGRLQTSGAEAPASTGGPDRPTGKRADPVR